MIHRGRGVESGYPTHHLALRTFERGAENVVLNQADIVSKRGHNVMVRTSLILQTSKREKLGSIVIERPSRLAVSKTTGRSCLDLSFLM